MKEKAIKLLSLQRCGIRRRACLLCPRCDGGWKQRHQELRAQDVEVDG